MVGKKPVALLFATPQLCASRVCGPVTDIALQMQAKYGDQMTFIHQEVYVDNDVTKGLREPLKQFNLPSEPWLFVVDKTGDDHRPARGLDRRRSVRGRRQVRPVRRALAVLAAALAAAVLVPAVADGARSRPAPAAPDPAVAVRVGRGRRAGDLVLRAGRAVAAAAAGARRLAPAARRSRVRLDGRCGSLCGRDRRAAAGRHDLGRLPRQRHRAGQLGADVPADHVLGRAGVRLDPVRRHLSRVLPVPGAGRAAAVAEPAVSRAVGALAGRDRAVRLHLGRARVGLGRGPGDARHRRARLHGADAGRAGLLRRRDLDALRRGVRGLLRHVRADLGVGDARRRAGRAATAGRADPARRRGRDGARS